MRKALTRCIILSICTIKISCIRNTNVQNITHLSRRLIFVENDDTDPLEDNDNIVKFKEENGIESNNNHYEISNIKFEETEDTNRYKSEENLHKPFKFAEDDRNVQNDNKENKHESTYSHNIQVNHEGSFQNNPQQANPEIQSNNVQSNKKRRRKRKPRQQGYPQNGGYIQTGYGFGPYSPAYGQEGYRPYYPNYRPRPSSPAEQALSTVTEALTSIARYDDQQCVPKLLCEVSAGRMRDGGGGAGSVASTVLNLQPLITLIAAYNGISASPIFVFGRAVFLGMTSKANANICSEAYPLCPSDPDKLVDYLNNYNGGFFRFFNNPQINLQGYGQQNVQQFLGHLSSLPQYFGPQNYGQQNFGPQTFGQQNGPQSFGQQNFSPQNFGQLQGQQNYGFQNFGQPNFDQQNNGFVGQPFQNYAQENGQYQNNIIPSNHYINEQSFPNYYAPGNALQNPNVYQNLAVQGNVQELQTNRYHGYGYNQYYQNPGFIQQNRLLEANKLKQQHCGSYDSYRFSAFCRSKTKSNDKIQRRILTKSVPDEFAALDDESNSAPSKLIFPETNPQNNNQRNPKAPNFQNSEYKLIFPTTQTVTTADYFKNRSKINTNRYTEYDYNKGYEVHENTNEDIKVNNNGNGEIVYIVRGNGDPNHPEVTRLRPGLKL